jgi:hypothetical protein
MNFARWSTWLCVSLVSAVLAASCTSAPDMADVVPALPGAFQPDAGGPLVDEVTACTKLSQAESGARAALGCDPVTRACPVYIRPAGGADCFLYSQASLDGCSELYDSFSSCDQFEQRPCLVTAVSTCIVAEGAGGQGGAASANGGAGAGGATNAGGQSGRDG